MTKSQPKPQQNLYFPELDGLRFFAFLLVFIHHHSFFKELRGWSYLHEYGWIGVDLFFVLSAFLFTKLLLAEFNVYGSISFKKFYVRRIFRIWPLYFFIIATSLLSCVFWLNKDLGNMALLRVAGLLFFSDNILTCFYGYTSLPFLSHLWTICFEEQVYLVIPAAILLLAKANKKQKIAAFALLVVVCTFLRVLFISAQVNHLTIWVLPFTHFESIFLGIVIGFGGADFIKNKLHSLFLLLLVSIMFILLIQLPKLETTHQWMNISFLLVGLITALILLVVQKNEHLKQFLCLQPLIFLGKRSYGLYVYHLFALFTVNRLWGNAQLAENRAISFLITLLITIFLAILSYKFLEIPFLKLKKRFEMVASRPI